MLFKILAAGLMATCLSVYFKEHKSSFGFVIIISASLVIVFMTLNYFGKVMDNIKSITEKFSGGMEYILMLFKMLGISYVCDLTAGICKDSGNAALAHQMQMFGKILILSLSIPLIGTLFELITELI